MDSDLQGGSGRGVTKVPAVFLGTQSFVENIQYDDLARAIDMAGPTADPSTRLLLGKCQQNLLRLVIDP